MDRVPEPELMLDDAQARAYAAADFEEPHGRLIALLRERLPDLPTAGRALDLGCGPGDVTLRFARAFAGWNIDGIDGSPAMLALARAAAEEAKLASCAHFHERLLPAESMPAESYDLVLSSSLLHHLPDPAILWSGIRRWTRPGAAVFVVDLLRPASRDAARALVERYSGNEPEVLRVDFFNSLLAAYRPEEVRAQLVLAGLGDLALEVVSDRHLVVWGGRLESPGG